jgi:WD40 repeat protein
MAYLGVSCDEKIHIYQCGLESYEHVAILECTLLSRMFYYSNVQCFAPDDSFLLADCGSHIITWDITSLHSNQSSSSPVTLTAHADSCIEMTPANSAARAAVFSSSGRQLLVNTFWPDQCIIFDWPSRAEVWRQSCTDSLSFFANRGEFIVTVSEQGGLINLHICSAADGSTIGDVILPQTTCRWQSEAAFSVHPIDPYVAAIDEGKVAIIRLTPLYGSIHDTDWLTIQEKSEVVSDIHFSSCGTKFLTNSKCGALRVWNSATWENTMIIQTGFNIAGAIYNFMTNQIACNSFDDDDNFARIFDGESGKLITKELFCDGRLAFSCSNSVILM